MSKNLNAFRLPKSLQDKLDVRAKINGNSASIEAKRIITKQLQGKK